MADKKRAIKTQRGDEITWVYVDQGDGTYAERVALVANAGVEIGDVAVASVNGAYATPTHSVVAVAAATSVALAANANRKYALLINDSDTTIYVKLGAAAVANQGVRLNANGGSYEMSNLSGNLYIGAINAIHGGTGNKVLLVTEGV